MKWRSCNDGSHPTRSKFVPLWRFRMALGVFFGFLFSLRNGILSLSEKEEMKMVSRFSQEPLARPFKVPGPESLCPASSDEGLGPIIFIESSGEECLTPRQVCGVESASRANPGMKIKVYINTDKLGPPGWADRFMRPGRVRSCKLNELISKYNNVEMIRDNFTALLENSPFRPLIDTGKIQESQWSVVQISDAIRLLLLQKHGGIYLDFDNVVFRPLHCLRNVFSYLEEKPNIENGILAMEAGHPFLKFLIRYLVQTYDPKNRVTLGPPAFGKAFQLFCHVNEPLRAGVYQCHGDSTVTLIHPDAFFPVKHYELRYFYSTSLEGYDIQTMERAYLTHVYLSSWGTKVHPNSLYARLARQYCPSNWELTHADSIPLGF